jgi:hypothetical protein
MKQLRIDFRFEDMGLALKGSGRKVGTFSNRLLCVEPHLPFIWLTG